MIQGVRTSEPTQGDPVVVGEVRFRIRRIEGCVARLRASYGFSVAVVDPRQLTWDQRAGVWRAERCTPTR